MAALKEKMTPKRIWNYEIIVEALPDILDHFHIDYVKNRKSISLACPVHEGVKNDALHIYTSGERFVGNWVCWTNHCEQEHGKTVVDFIRCLLKKHDISLPASDWLRQFIGQGLTEDVGEEYFAKKDSINTADILAKASPTQTGVTREYIRNSLIIPAKYYLDRGYLRSTLDRYDVGLCMSPGKQMNGRVVVPVYNDCGTIMVGCVGRSIKPQCLLCKKYHYTHELCPQTSYEMYSSSKWVNSKDFKVDNYLYNFWNVSEYAKKWNSVILTEGQGDVWRLEEAGIPVGLGVFGAKLTDGQLIKLQSLPITNIIIAMDTDPAGQKANTDIVTRLKRFYNVESVLPTGKDLGDMSTNDVRELFYPIIERYKLHV